VLWKSDDGVSCELWVSADERLILYRPEAKIPVTLHRAGRSLYVPCGKPVVVIDKDQIDVGSRRLRVHVHGNAPLVAAPSPLPSKPRPLGRLAQVAAAAAVIGAVAAAGGCIDVREDPPQVTIEIRQTPPEITVPTSTIEIREAPPADVAPPTIEIREESPTATPSSTPVDENSIEKVIQGEWIAAQAYDVEDERAWITGTLTIEGNSYTFTPTREVTGTSVQGNLDFLFDTPRGEVTIEYRGTGHEIFEDFAPGDELATCVFRADSMVLGEFLIRVGDSNSLHFHSPSSEVSLWSVTKQVRSDTEQ